MDCPHGFEAHVGWSSRCKNCFRGRNEHSAASLSSQHRRRASASTSSAYQYSTDLSVSHTQTPYRRPKLSSSSKSPGSTPTVIQSSTTTTQSRLPGEPSSHPRNYSYDTDNSKLLLVPSALKESRSHSGLNYAPPEMHYSPYVTSTDKPISYATLPRKRQSFHEGSSTAAHTQETFSSSKLNVSAYATLPRKTSADALLGGSAYQATASSSSGYKRISPNEALLRRTSASSNTHSSSTLSLPKNDYSRPGSAASGTYTPSAYVSSAGRRRWSSVSTPVTPTLLRSPATTPRIRSPTRTFSPTVPARPYSSCSNYRTYSSSSYYEHRSSQSRNNSLVTSPAFSRSTSRRSSIGHEDQFQSRIINRDPFKDTMQSKSDDVAMNSSSKYASSSLPRNFSLQNRTHLNVDDISVASTAPASPRPGSDGIQRKYRRSHRQPIPLLEEKNPAVVASSMAQDNLKAKCSNEGCANNSKSFNLTFSVLAECWKCKQSSPSTGEYILRETDVSPLAFVTTTVEDLPSRSESDIAPLASLDDEFMNEAGAESSQKKKKESSDGHQKDTTNVAFGNTLKTLRKRARKKSSSPSAVAETLEQQQRKNVFSSTDDQVMASLSQHTTNLPNVEEAVVKNDTEIGSGNDVEQTFWRESEKINTAAETNDVDSLEETAFVREDNEKVAEEGSLHPKRVEKSFETRLPTTKTLVTTMQNEQESSEASSTAKAFHNTQATIKGTCAPDFEGKVDEKFKSPSLREKNEGTITQQGANEMERMIIDDDFASQMDTCMRKPEIVSESKSNDVTKIEDERSSNPIEQQSDLVNEITEEPLGKASVEKPVYDSQIKVCSEKSDNALAPFDTLNASSPGTCGNVEAEKADKTSKEAVNRERSILEDDSKSYDYVDPKLEEKHLPLLEAETEQTEKTRSAASSLGAKKEETLDVEPAKLSSNEKSKSEQTLEPLKTTKKKEKAESKDDFLTTSTSKSQLMQDLRLHVEKCDVMLETLKKEDTEETERLVALGKFHYDTSSLKNDAILSDTINDDEEISIRGAQVSDKYIKGSICAQRLSDIDSIKTASEADVQPSTSKEASEFPMDTESVRKEAVMVVNCDAQTCCYPLPPQSPWQNQQEANSVEAVLETYDESPGARRRRQKLQQESNVKVECTTTRTGISLEKMLCQETRVESKGNEPQPTSNVVLAAQTSFTRVENLLGENEVKNQPPPPPPPPTLLLGNFASGALNSETEENNGSKSEIPTEGISRPGPPSELLLQGLEENFMLLDEEETSIAPPADGQEDLLLNASYFSTYVDNPSASSSPSSPVTIIEVDPDDLTLAVSEILKKDFELRLDENEQNLGLVPEMSLQKYCPSEAMDEIRTWNEYELSKKDGKIEIDMGAENDEKLEQASMVEQEMGKLQKVSPSEAVDEMKTWNEYNTQLKKEDGKIECDKGAENDEKLEQAPMQSPGQNPFQGSTLLLEENEVQNIGSQINSRSKIMKSEDDKSEALKDNVASEKKEDEKPEIALDSRETKCESMTFAAPQLTDQLSWQPESTPPKHEDFHKSESSKKVCQESKQELHSEIKLEQKDATPETFEIMQGVDDENPSIQREKIPGKMSSPIKTEVGKGDEQYSQTTSFAKSHVDKTDAAQIDTPPSKKSITSAVRKADNKVSKAVQGQCKSSKKESNKEGESTMRKKDDDQDENLGSKGNNSKMQNVQIRKETDAPFSNMPKEFAAQSEVNDQFVGSQQKPNIASSLQPASSQISTHKDQISSVPKETETKSDIQDETDAISSHVSVSEDELEHEDTCFSRDDYEDNATHKEVLEASIPEFEVSMEISQLASEGSNTGGDVDTCLQKITCFTHASLKSPANEFDDIQSDGTLLDSSTYKASVQKDSSTTYEDIEAIGCDNEKSNEIPNQSKDDANKKSPEEVSSLPTSSNKKADSPIMDLSKMEMKSSEIVFQVEPVKDVDVENDEDRSKENVVIGPKYSQGITFCQQAALTNDSENTAKTDQIQGEGQSIDSRAIVDKSSLEGNGNEESTAQRSEKESTSQLVNDENQGKDQSRSKRSKKAPLVSQKEWKKPDQIETGLTTVKSKRPSGADEIIHTDDNESCSKDGDNIQTTTKSDKSPTDVQKSTCLSKERNEDLAPTTSKSVPQLESMPEIIHNPEKGHVKPSSSSAVNERHANDVSCDDNIPKLTRERATRDSQTMPEMKMDHPLITEHKMDDGLMAEIIKISDTEQMMTVTNDPDVFITASKDNEESQSHVATHQRVSLEEEKNTFRKAIKHGNEEKEEPQKNEQIVVAKNDTVDAASEDIVVIHQKVSRGEEKVTSQKSAKSEKVPSLPEQLLKEIDTRPMEERQQESKKASLLVEDEESLKDYEDDVRRFESYLQPQLIPSKSLESLQNDVEKIKDIAEADVGERNPTSDVKSNCGNESNFEGHSNETKSPMHSRVKKNDVEMHSNMNEITKSPIHTNSEQKPSVAETHLKIIDEEICAVQLTSSGGGNEIGGFEEGELAKDIKRSNQGDNEKVQPSSKAVKENVTSPMMEATVLTETMKSLGDIITTKANQEDSQSFLPNSIGGATVKIHMKDMNSPTQKMHSISSEELGKDLINEQGCDESVGPADVANLPSKLITKSEMEIDNRNLKTKENMVVENEENMDFCHPIPAAPLETLVETEEPENEIINVKKGNLGAIRKRLDDEKKDSKGIEKKKQNSITKKGTQRKPISKATEAPSTQVLRQDEEVDRSEKELSNVTEILQEICDIKEMEKTKPAIAKPDSFQHTKVSQATGGISPGDMVMTQPASDFKLVVKRIEDEKADDNSVNKEKAFQQGQSINNVKDGVMPKEEASIPSENIMDDVDILEDASPQPQEEKWITDHKQEFFIHHEKEGDVNEQKEYFEEEMLRSEKMGSPPPLENVKMPFLDARKDNPQAVFQFANYNDEDDENLPRSAYGKALNEVENSPGKDPIQLEPFKSFRSTAKEILPIEHKERFENSNLLQRRQTFADDLLPHHRSEIDNENAISAEEMASKQRLEVPERKSNLTEQKMSNLASSISCTPTTMDSGFFEGPFKSREDVQEPSHLVQECMAVKSDTLDGTTQVIEKKDEQTTTKEKDVMAQRNASSFLPLASAGKSLPSLPSSDARLRTNTNPDGGGRSQREEKMMTELQPQTSIMKSFSENNTRRNSSSDMPMSFQELLQERRRALSKYSATAKDTTNEEAKPEWMLTRASIIKKAVEAVPNIPQISEPQVELEQSGLKIDEPEGSVTPQPEDLFHLSGSFERQPQGLDNWGQPPPFASDAKRIPSESGSEGIPSLVQELDPESLGGHSMLMPPPPKVMNRSSSETDLPMCAGSELVCNVLPNAPSTDTINSSELESFDSTTPVNMEPEKLAPIFNKLRKKEKSLRLRAHDLENKLEMSETHCYNLVEENCELKTAIESLEDEILEVQDRFHDEDAVEWKRMKSEVRAMAKMCRTFQLKLKKAEVQSGKLKAENAQLARSVSKDLRRRHQSVPPSSTSQQVALQQGSNDMLKNAVIWGAVLVAGYQFLKSKI